MFVKRPKYERLLEERDYWRDAYQDMARRCGDELRNADELNNRVCALLDDIAKLKQMYADEVQKRIALIEQMKKQGGESDGN